MKRLLFLGCLLSCGVSLAATQPNIILILADDLGYGELGCYGQQLIKTPELDQLAHDGIRFTQFYAGATVCAPSRCVLMTGLHSGHARVRGNAQRTNPLAQTLRKTDVTLAHIMQQHGYHTGLVGKWGLGKPGDSGHPNRQGFHEFFGYCSQFHAHNHYPNHLWRNETRVDLPNDLVPVGEEGAGYATQPTAYAGDVLANEALEFIQRHHQHPFLLYFAPVVPHANNERSRALGDGQEVPSYEPYADRDWSSATKGQAAMITRLDSDLGRLRRKLAELQLDQQTLILFSSDNGPHQEGGHDANIFNPNGPYRGYKRDLSDGGIRVPMLACWPGTIAPGQVSPVVGHFCDLVPTIADLIGASTPTTDGRSLKSVLVQGTLLPPPPALYWEFHEGGFSQAVLLDGRYKAMRLKHRDAPLQLFDLQTDPSEEHDLAATFPAIANRARDLLGSSHTPSDDWPIRDAPPARR